jgi:hypothetical protein
MKRTISPVVVTPFVVTILSLVCAVAFGVFPTRPAQSQPQQDRRELAKRVRSMGSIPIREADEESDAKLRLARVKRNKRFNRPAGVAQGSLLNVPNGVDVGRLDEEPGLPPVPISESAIVLTGEVVRKQPYLSEDQASIYTEFTIQIEEIIKNSGKDVLQSRDLVMVEIEGGALQLRNGRVVKYGVIGKGSLLNLNSRYLLFLSPIDDDLTITKAYEIDNDFVIPFNSGNGEEKYLDFSPIDFLEFVRRETSRAMKSGKDIGPQ